MKNICILYNGGSYGTFIEWCLNYFIGAIDALPFDDKGAAHKNYYGTQLETFSNCKKYINSDNNFPIVRLHPKSNKDDNILDNLKFINDHFNKIIYLIPNKNTIAWNINNKFEKIWAVGWVKQHETLFADSLAGWGRENLEQMKPWELREFLSLYIYRQHLSECEFGKIQDIQKKFTKFKFITIDSLRDNFEDTITALLEYCELVPTRLDKIEEIYQKWISCQHHCHKDKIIDDIVDSILNNKDYDWSNHNLTLLDESLIQFYLSKHGIKIKCYNLDIFPTNTKILRNYLVYLT